MNVYHFLTPYTVISSQWITGLTVWVKSLKLIKEDTEETITGKIDGCCVVEDRKENSSRGREWKLVLNVADTVSKIETEKELVRSC